MISFTVSNIIMKTLEDNSESDWTSSDLNESKIFSYSESSFSDYQIEIEHVLSQHKFGRQKICVRKAVLMIGIFLIQKHFDNASSGSMLPQAPIIVSSRK
ncbi:hypothetical protein ACFW04_013578 [Cataglyphis niger]